MLNFERKTANNCNAIIMSQKMERESTQGDRRVHGSHFIARSLFLIIYAVNG